MKLAQHGTAGSELMLQTTSDPVAMLGDEVPSEEAEEKVLVSCPLPVWMGSSPFTISEASGMLLAGEEKLFVWKFDPNKVKSMTEKREKEREKMRCSFFFLIA